MHQSLKIRSHYWTFALMIKATWAHKNSFICHILAQLWSILPILIHCSLCHIYLYSLKYMFYHHEKPKYYCVLITKSTLFHPKKTMVPRVFRKRAEKKIYCSWGQMLIFQWLLYVCEFLKKKKNKLVSKQEKNHTIFHHFLRLFSVSLLKKFFHDENKFHWEKYNFF